MFHKAPKISVIPVHSTLAYHAEDSLNSSFSCCSIAVRKIPIKLIYLMVPSLIRK